MLTVRFIVRAGLGDMIRSGLSCVRLEVLFLTEVGLGGGLVVLLVLWDLLRELLGLLGFHGILLMLEATWRLGTLQIVWQFALNIVRHLISLMMRLMLQVQKGLLNILELLFMLLVHFNVSSVGIFICIWWWS